MKVSKSKTNLSDWKSQREWFLQDYLQRLFGYKGNFVQIESTLAYVWYYNLKLWYLQVSIAGQPQGVESARAKIRVGALLRPRLLWELEMSIGRHYPCYVARWTLTLPYFAQWLRNMSDHLTDVCLLFEACLLHMNLKKERENNPLAFDWYKTMLVCCLYITNNKMWLNLKEQHKVKNIVIVV